MTIFFPYMNYIPGGGGGGGSISVVEGSGLIAAITSGDRVTISSKTYVHEQGIASDTWEIVHNLNKFPTVVLVDSAGTTFGAAVTYNSSNKCTIKMNGATTGKAYLN